MTNDRATSSFNEPFAALNITLAANARLSASNVSTAVSATKWAQIFLIQESYIYLDKYALSTSLRHGYQLNLVRCLTSIGIFY